ncbi:phosphotransferase [Pseudoroseicyclus tamaricis]|uniref:Phosphotransferase n=1 Tax=Pseudoroseicyclus tamaricis TaxID=2705421 RepID=A0A6B2K2Q4_9RHOB|nr:phosphotransferase [Pseudoroseicyclus tamaricis]NDV02884.1 phosphotransferase [Pseudoroseicyclus tamaricis]
MLHEDETRVSAGAARALIDAQFPDFRGEEVAALGGGTDNALFRIGRRATARFPLRAEGAEALGREAEAKEELAAHCPVATPRPLGFGEPGGGHPLPWALESWVEGAMATPEGLGSSAAFAGDLAALIGALRRAETKGRPFAAQGRGGTLMEHDAWMATCLQRSGGLLDIPPLRRLWQAFRVLAPPTRLAMCHKDLIPANLLVEGERLVGVLDGGGFGPADPALDLVAAWHHLEAEGRALIRTRLGCDEAEWRRGAVWAFQQALGLVWYYEKSHPGMVALGRSTLRRIMSDEEVGAA